MADFWTQFAKELTKSGENRPKGNGWKTPLELGVIWKITTRRAGMRACEGVRMGKIEFYEGHVMRNKKLCRTRWYRPTP